MILKFQHALPCENFFGSLEPVFSFYDAMPTGVTISEKRRIFVNFPKWGDEVKFTVGEIKNNKLVPYPDLKTNRVDLCSGRAVRRLNGYASTSADPKFLAKVEGEILLNRDAKGNTSEITIGADGIAISEDGKKLYYCPLASRDLFAIKTKYLRDESIKDCNLCSYVEYLGEKGASDGLITDAKGTLYAGDYENNSIRKITKDGEMATILHSQCLLWPDTFTIGCDGYLYVIANQLHRQARYHYGKDMREKPYSLFKICINELPAPTK